MVEGAIASSQLNPTGCYHLGRAGYISRSKFRVEINGYSTVIDAEINATNGIIHAID